MKKAKAILSSVFVLLLVFGTVMITSAAEVTETEPNNDKSQASEFNISNVMNGSLSDTSDIDWFKVSATKFGMAHLTVVTKGTDDFNVTVYDSNDNLLVKFNASGSKTESSLFAVQSGAYYIKVEPGSVVSSSSYTLDLTSETYDNGEVEPNNDIAYANIIKLNTIHSSSDYMGSVKPGDTDWFRFTSVSGYFYYELKKVDNGSGTVKADVISIVGTGDTGNTVVGSISSATKNKLVRSADIGTKEQTYFIRVTGDGAYSVAVRAFLDSKNEYEYNDTTVYANNLTIDYNGRLYGSISHSGDADMFRITTTDADKNTLITVSAFNGEGYKEYDKNASWNVALISNAGKVLDEKLATATKPAEINLAEQGAGTYYLRITKGSVSTIANYIITSSAAPEPEKQYDSLLSRLRYGIDWKSFWERNPLKELMGNIDMMRTFGSLIKLSFGTIGQWIIRLIASRAAT